MVADHLRANRLLDAKGAIPGLTAATRSKLKLVFWPLVKMLGLRDITHEDIVAVFNFCFASAMKEGLSEKNCILIMEALAEAVNYRMQFRMAISNDE